MKEFKTITEYEVLKMMYRDLLERIIKDENSIAQYRIDYERNPQIATKRLKKLDEQLEEVRERIIEIEQKS